LEERGCLGGEAGWREAGLSNARGRNPKWLGFIYSASPIKSIDIALQAKI